jgi:predicted transposase/invertase (TIGR01784 family)
MEIKNRNHTGKSVYLQFVKRILMAKYLDPKIDVLFKKIFGENKDMVISFLNSLLPLPEGQEIVTIEYLSPEQVPATPLGKNSIVDINCVDNTGRAFIVEMQTEWSNVFRKRLLVNGSKAVIRKKKKKSLKAKAQKFNELKPVYVLAIVNDNFSTGKDWYHHLQIMDPKNPNIVIDGLDFVLVEIPKFTPETWNFAHKQLAVLWLRFLKEIDGYNEKLPKEFKSNKLIRSAIKLCEKAALSPEELFAYEHSEIEMIWQNSIKAVEEDAIESRKALDESRKALDESRKALDESRKALDEKDKALEIERKAHIIERSARKKLEAELEKLKQQKK